MQKGRSRASALETISKPVLLGIITIVVAGVVAPLAVIPHVIHPSMIFHNLLHMAGLTIAVFLSTVSLLVYLRNMTTRNSVIGCGDHNEAILTLQRIPADDPNYSNATNNIGRAFFAMGQFQEGLN
jgi:hypothetical protein